jgi:hypothetical protein
VNLTVISGLETRNRDDQFAGVVENRADPNEEIYEQKECTVNSFPRIELAHRGSLFLREIENLLLQEQELTQITRISPKSLKLLKSPEPPKPLEPPDSLKFSPFRQFITGRISYFHFTFNRLHGGPRFAFREGVQHEDAMCDMRVGKLQLSKSARNGRLTKSPNINLQWPTESIALLSERNL